MERAAHIVSTVRSPPRQCCRKKQAVEPGMEELKLKLTSESGVHVGPVLINGTSPCDATFLGEEGKLYKLQSTTSLLQQSTWHNKKVR